MQDFYVMLYILVLYIAEVPFVVLRYLYSYDYLIYKVKMTIL